MEKMWAGRFSKALDKEADDFNSSIHFDCKMYKQDITGSMEHAAMLSACNIISQDESLQIIDGLQTILDDIDSGKLAIDTDAEDIHEIIKILSQTVVCLKRTIKGSFTPLENLIV